jgi:hypothetical protein
MKLEERYVVLKRSDLQKYIKRQFRLQLQGVVETINQHRDFFESKGPLKCVVVESDWPEYERVWKMIESRVNAVPVEKAITQFFDTIALDTARNVMCDVNRRSDFLGGDTQLLSRIQCRVDEAIRAAIGENKNA